jgi:hypothetical protein
MTDDDATDGARLQKKAAANARIALAAALGFRPTDLSDQQA